MNMQSEHRPFKGFFVNFQVLQLALSFGLVSILKQQLLISNKKDESYQSLHYIHVLVDVEDDMSTPQNMYTEKPKQRTRTTLRS